MIFLKIIIFSDLKKKKKKNSVMISYNYILYYCKLVFLCYDIDRNY